MLKKERQDRIVGLLKEQCNRIVKNIGNVLTLHDFRVVFGETHTNLIFDVKKTRAIFLVVLF